MSLQEVGSDVAEGRAHAVGQTLSDPWENSTL